MNLEKNKMAGEKRPYFSKRSKSERAEYMAGQMKNASIAILICLVLAGLVECGVV